MRAVRVMLFVLMFFLLILSGPSFAKSLQTVGDSELDGIYARGWTFLMDANTMCGTGITGRSLSDNRTFNLYGPTNMTLRNSLVLSDDAQRNSFGVVNAINSAVNMPINIVVLINSQLSGGINISNIMSAIK